MIDKELELNEQGQARRRFLKQAATVAWASPFIVTMMSRAAHAQPQSCGVMNELLLCDVTFPCGTGLICRLDGSTPSPGRPCSCLTP